MRPTGERREDDVLMMTDEKLAAELVRAIDEILTTEAGEGIADCGATLSCMGKHPHNINEMEV